MLMFIAGLTAIALLTTGTESRPIPDDKCLAIAKAVAVDWQPFADKIAGQHLDITVIAGTPGKMLRMVEEKNGKKVVVAEINGANEIVIFQEFCDGHPMFKVSVIAHEIGHLIDISKNPTPIFFRKATNIFTPWKEREVEKIAIKYSHDLIELSGLDKTMFETFEEK